MKWFCKPLGIVGVTVEQESAQPHLPPISLSLSLSLSLLLSFSHFSFTLAQTSNSLTNTLLGNWDNSLHSCWKFKVGWILFGYFVMRMNGFMKLKLWAIFFFRGRCKLCFFVGQQFHELFWYTLLLAQSTYTRVVATTGSCGQGTKKRGRGWLLLLLFCHSIFQKWVCHFVNEL
jgi:hypothetical protein